MFNYKLAWWMKPMIGIIDILGSVVFFWTKLKPFPKKIKKILIIRAEHIGDVFMATPTFRALKERFPEAEIDVIVRTFTKEVLEGNKNVRTIVCNLPWFSTKGTWKEVFEIIPKLKQKKYDLVIDMHGDPRNILLSYVIGGYRIGFGIRGLGFLLNKTVKWENKTKHTIERNLDLIKAIGINSEIKLNKLQMEAHASHQDMHFAEELFKKNNITNAVCINPGAGRKEKMWNNRQWARVADFMADKGATIIFTGSKPEQKEVQEIINNMSNKTYVDICGKTTINQLVAVIKKCKLVLCPDTGIMHIAKAVKTPVLALFGPEDPRTWGYKDRNSTFIKTNDLSRFEANEFIAAINKFYK